MKAKRSWWCCWKVIIQIRYLRLWDLALDSDGFLSLFPSFHFEIYPQTDPIHLFVFFHYYFLLTCLTIIHNDRSSENHIYSVSARTHAPIFSVSISFFCFGFLFACSVTYKERTSQSFIQHALCVHVYVWVRLNSLLPLAAHLFAALLLFSIECLIWKL